MADFAQWATAAESALGLADGAFMAAYTSNRSAGNDLVLESSPVGRAVVRLMQDRQTVKSTATELLDQLRRSATDHEQSQLPREPRSLSSELKRLAPAQLTNIANDDIRF